MEEPRGSRESSRGRIRSSVRTSSTVWWWFLSGYQLGVYQRLLNDAVVYNISETCNGL